MRRMPRVSLAICDVHGQTEHLILAFLGHDINCCAECIEEEGTWDSAGSSGASQSS